MNADSQNSDMPFLAGGGEMGRLMRSKDWSQTPLGPTSGWPQSLRTTLSIILNSRFPMFLFWGPELICFYNDAYRPSLGEEGKHPSILGQKAEEQWKEIWHIIKPLIDEVRAGGQASWSEDQLIPIYRNGQMEDVYWTFSYSPVKDESGEIAGIFITCIETTDKVKSFAKTAENERKFRNTVKQAPVGITIMRGPEFVVEMANESYLQIVHKTEEDFVGRPLFQSLPEIKEAVEPLLNAVLKTGTAHSGNEFELTINRFGKSQSVYFNFVYQPLYESDGTISGIIAIANEITGQITARSALQEREKQFSNIVMRSPIAMTVWRGEDYIIEMANEELLKNIWHKQPHEVLGKKALEVFPELLDQKYPELLSRVYHSGITYSEKESLAYINGNDGVKKFYLDFEYSPLFEPDGSISGVMITVNNVTDRVEDRQKLEDTEARLRLAIEATNLATWDLNLQTRNIIYSARLPVIFGHTELTRITHADMRGQIHRNDLPAVEKAFDTAMQTGIYDYEARVIKPDGSMCRIRTQGKVIFGNDGTPLRMLGTIMDITDQKRSEENMARLAAIVQSSDDAIISKKLNGVITSWNNGAERIFGYTESEMLGEIITKLIPEPLLDEEPAILSQLGKGLRVEHFETQRITKNRKIIDVSLTISPLKDSTGAVIGVSKIARDITRQKQAERLIAENEARLQIILSASDLGTWEINLQSGEVDYSERYIEMLGYEKGILMSHDELKKHLHPDDLLTREEAFKAALETGHLSYQTRIIWNDASVHWLEAKGKVLYDDKGKPYKLTGTIRDITAERSYQKRIEESEKRFRIVADTAPVLIWMSGPDSYCNFLNKAWLDYTGRMHEQEVGNGWMENIHKDDLNRVVKIHDAAFRLKEPFSIEYRLKRHDGEYRWISNNGLPRFTEDGVFEGFIGASMDIHDRILFEEKLKESESRLRIAALSSELGTWDYNPTTKILRWDNASRELFGVDPDIFITMELFWSKLHPDDREEASQRMFQALDPEKAETYDTEFRIIGLPDNQTRWLHAKGKAFFNQDGVPYLFSGTVLDVTEKRLALEELQENEQKFRMLADSMPQFIWTGDDMGNLNYFNKSVYDYTGLTPQQIATDGWLQIIHPDDRAENIRRWMYSVSTGEHFLFEHRFRRSDGEYRWQLSRAAPQMDVNGAIQMWVGTSTDIHDQKTFSQELENQVQQRTSELKQANEELMKSNSELAQFAYVASHDLQEPLRKIQTFSSRILDSEDDNLSDKGKDYFIRMQSASKRMQQLILDLLSYSRASISEKHFGPVDLNTVIQTVTDQLKESIEQKQADINAVNLPVIKAIPYQFEQLFMNLLTNALKFSKEDVRPVVNITHTVSTGKNIDHPAADPKKRYHTITVSDNGIGFDPQFSDRIFHVFQRLHGREEYAGTGIGLSIVKKIVENHYGFIDARSELNKGATFTIYIPVS